jgi:gliding motility-associated protein GldC
MVEKQSEIRFKISLSKENIPQDIKWQATDTQNKELRDCKSIMISIWDAVQKETLKIDLWTNEMSIDEMHSHFFQTMLSMADSYQKATKNPYVKEDMKKFAEELARKTADWENSKEN